MSEEHSKDLLVRVAHFEECQKLTQRGWLTDGQVAFLAYTLVLLLHYKAGKSFTRRDKWLAPTLVFMTKED